MLAATGTKHDQDQNKDSIANIEATGVFCVNIVSHAQQDALLSSPPSGGGKCYSNRSRNLDTGTIRSSANCFRSTALTIEMVRIETRLHRPLGASP